METRYDYIYKLDMEQRLFRDKAVNTYLQSGLVLHPFIGYTRLLDHLADILITSGKLLKTRILKSSAFVTGL